MGGQVGSFHNSYSEYLITYDGVINENFFPLKERELTMINNLEIYHSKVKSPITNKTEYFLGLLLKSKYDGTKGIREPIDICITLDISGSMNAPIDNEGKTRNQLSLEAIVNLIGQLEEEDGIAINTFDEKSHNIVPFSFKKDLTDENINNIKAIIPCGNENIYNALEGAMKQLEKSIKKNKRIIIITDLWAHDRDLQNFKKLFKECVNEKHIELTLIGISQDANSHLAEIVTYERGCSYFNVLTSKDLEKYLVKDFNYFCFPYSYDLKIKFGSGDSKVTQCIGVGEKKIESEKLIVENDNVDGNFLKHKRELKDLFLCMKKKGYKLPGPVCVCIANYLKYNKLNVCEIGTAIASELNIENSNTLMEGGLILLKLDNQNQFKGGEDIDFSCDISLEYVDRNNKPYCQHYKYIINKETEQKDDFYSSNAIQHGMALYYYTNLCRNLLNYKNACSQYNFLDLEENRRNQESNSEKELEKYKKEKEKYVKYHEKNILEKVLDYLNKNYLKGNDFNDRLKGYIEKLNNSFELDTPKRYQGE